MFIFPTYFSLPPSSTKIMTSSLFHLITWFRVQFWINKHDIFFQRLRKFTSAYLFQIARKKPCDYILMIYIKIRDSWSQLCRSKARALTAKIFHLNPEGDIARSVKTTACDQRNNLRWHFHIFEAQKKVQSPAIQFKALFSLLCYFFALN